MKIRLEFLLLLSITISGLVALVWQGLDAIKMVLVGK